MDWKQRIGTLGVLLACTSVGLAKAPPVVNLTGDDAVGEFRVGQLFVVDNTVEGSSEVRAGGDLCASAVTIPWPLPGGAYNDTGDTSLAGIGDQYHTNDCNGDDGRARDLVYKITPTTNELLVITGCADPNGDGAPGGAPGYDARGWVYENCCPGDLGCPTTEPIICSDDGCGAFAGPPNMIISVTAGVTYYIVQDGWGSTTSNRGSYGIQVRVAPPAPNCDRLNSCTNNETFASTEEIGDRYYIYNTLEPVTPTNPSICADLGGPCPDVPIALFQCDPGLLFCTGFFCDGLGVGCDAGTAGSPSRVQSDFAGGRGGLDTIGFESFWGITDVIGGVVVWGEDFTVDPDTGLPAANCTKTQFRVTYYADNSGEPGGIVAGPFDVTATQTTSGVGFAGSPSGINKFSMAHDPVCLKQGWVSVQGLTDADNPTCEYWAVTTDLTQLASGRDDNHYWFRNLDGDMVQNRFRGALMFGLAPGEAVTGACCNDSTTNCTNNANCADCPATSRFIVDTACVDIVPLCGNGACCFANGDCDDSLTQTACTNAGGTSFTAGVSCAADPANPAGVHCPPANDACSSVTPENGGLPYNFTGRNDGATAEAGGCASLEEVVWEAFTISECSDLVLDYCGTENDQTNPTFLGTPIGALYSNCSCSGARTDSCQISNTARAGVCCIDDPPGYNGNYSITFPRVPAGTWYYPVKSGSGATGVYSINVTGSTCDPIGSCVTCTGTAEGEAACSGNNDTCATADDLACGATVCGTASATDQDWYKVTLGAAATLTWEVRAEFPAQIRILDGVPGCGADLSTLVLGEASGCLCEDLTAVSACVTAGTYYVVVEPQPGQTFACGATYSAKVTCGGACSPAVGACCTGTGTVPTCTDGSTQARCDAAHGHYRGDNTTCVSSPCPSFSANNECLTATVIPTNIGSNGATYTLDRRLLSTNATDGGNSCEAVIAAKDASAWFTWTTPFSAQPHRLLASLCCDDGGAEGDTLVNIYGGNRTCAQIAANPLGQLLFCSDESVDCGEQRAEACLNPAGSNGNTTYKIQVQIKDNGGANEENLFTLYTKKGCSGRGAALCPAVPICPAPPACPGGAITDTEPACTTDYVDNHNNGCSPGNPFGFGTIACGQSYCGTTGNYSSNGAGGPDAERDRDWYLFDVPEESEIVWTAQSAGDATQGPGLTAQIWRIDDVNCSDGSFVNRAGVSDDENCTPIVASATVEPGRYAVTVFGRTVDQDPDPGDQLCGTPWVASLACSSANTLPTPANDCASAIIANGPGRYSGSINTNGDAVVTTADGESSCDGAGGDANCCDGTGVLPDRYIRYTATCTGRVTVDGCQSPSPLLLSIHSGCPARCGNEIPPTAFCDDGLGISCNTFGCGQGGSRPFVTFDTVEGQTYVIRAALTSGNSGTYVVRISECVDGCQEAGVPAATVTSAVSRRTNPHARVDCDTNLQLSAIPVGRKTEPHSGGVQEIRIGFDVPPGGGGSGFALFEASCPTGTFSASGQVLSGSVVGNELVLTSAGLNNARTYRIDLDATVTSVAGQSVFVRGLVGDVNSDGLVNATDRSVVVGAWTGPGGWSCPTDVNNSGATNATDRSVVVGAWTGGIATNCAP